LNSFNEEFKEIETAYNMGDHLREFEKLKERLVGKPVVLFGAAWIGDYFYQKLTSNGVAVECFCDNFAVGVTPAGHSPIIKPAELKERYPNAQVIISCDKARDIIHKQLLELGFKEEQIIIYPKQLLATFDMQTLAPYLSGYEWAYNFFNDDISKQIIISRINCYLFGTSMEKSYFPQYFERDVYKLAENEVFVDGGFFTGDTTEEFIRQTSGKYKHIYGFEPDKHSREKATENLKSFADIDIIEKGLYSEETHLNFASTEGNSRASGGNIVEADGDNVLSIPVTSIDQFFKNKPINEYPTFIKMDIEGTEKAALLGAENVIRQAKPKLAICVYHKPEDIYELTQLIYKFNPDYKFTLRHYANYFWETVLYAV
jgi:FkbM family methyltransferase